MYNTTPTRLQNFWQNTSFIQKLIILLIPIFIIIIIIVSILSIITKHHNTSFDDTDAYHINITNFNQTGATKDYQLALQKYLWNILQYSNIPYDTNTDAKIRQDSLSKSTENDYSTAIYIIDIPTLKQSFNIEYTWPTNSQYIDMSLSDQYNIQISCPNYLDVIYEGQICRLSDNPYDSIDQYLPNYNTYDGINISIEKQRYSQEDNGTTSGQSFLWVSLNTCNNKELLSKAKQYLNNWLKIRLVNPNDFLVEYYEYCD